MKSNSKFDIETLKKDIESLDAFYTEKFVSGEGKKMLNNILTALAFIRPEIGYCQGMNFIAGALLEFLNEEKLSISVNNATLQSEINNGYIEVKETAIKDEEVSVTVYPNQGYKLSSLVFNDGTQDYDITSTKSFTMPEGAVSVTATFEEKGEQVVTIVLDEKFIYPNTPYITEKQTYSTSNYYEKLGDGVVTVEYKPKGADDSEYTTEVPTEYGEYTLRVSVAEGSEYKAGFATKDFIYSPQIITQVGFGNLQQPVAGAVVPEKTGGMLVNTKYSETLTWYPEISTVNEDGNKIFDCDTSYTAIVTLTLKDSFADNYVFADKPTLKGAGTGWVLSEDSTDKMLIYTKEFEPTADHSVNKISGTDATCTKDGFKDAYQCETCGLYYEDAAHSKLIGDETAYNAWKLNEGKIQARHVVSKVSGVDPTKESSGYKEAWKCSECGQYFEDEACTVLIGDETAYNAWKSVRGYLPQLSSEGLSGGAIAGITVGSVAGVCLISYVAMFFVWKKNQKALKFLTPSFKWINTKIFKK